jgi:ketosteroid isomerase-like protein
MSTYNQAAERCLPAEPNYPQVLVRIETILQGLAGIRQDLGISGGTGTPGGVSAAVQPSRADQLFDAIHYRLLGAKLKRLEQLPAEILRPLSEDAVLVDMPSGRSFNRVRTGAPRHESYEGSTEGWELMFPEEAMQTYNVIGTEDYIVIESVTTGTFQAPLVYGEETTAAGDAAQRTTTEGGVVQPTGGTVEIFSADVIRLENGLVVSFETYYDMAGVLRQMGLMGTAPIGHDQTTTVPPIIHASGFAPDSAARSPRHAGHHHGPATTAPQPAGATTPHRPAGTTTPQKPAGSPTKPGTSAPTHATSSGYQGARPPHAVRGERRVSVGSSKTARAQKNKENCIAIHEAFVEHRPEKFQELIAPEAVWVDVPTGQVLDGAIAAAEHDHGNWMTAFPDSDAEVTNLIANDEWVVVQHRGYGSHTGPLQLGDDVYRPTGRTMEIKVLDIVQYENERAVNIRNYYDVGLMMRQLGMLPDQVKV